MRALCRNHSLRVCVAWMTCLTMLLPPAAIAEDGLFGLFRGQSAGTPVEQLARQIDKLEKHIDQNGSIVIKTPDVWGESRLMRHRSDVETQLKARLGAFDFRINAIQSTRDAAFLATAVALQEQIAAGVTAVPATATTPGTPGSPGDVSALTATSFNAASSRMIGNPTDGTNTFLVPRNVFLTQTKPTIGIEPVIELDQMNRYLQHLNELRRLNEGDDNSDTPGYALNLIRIPVSVLPGRRTEQGFGAEVQITIDPYMSDEILPMAFKDFVINGVVDRISFDVFQLSSKADIPVREPTSKTQSTNTALDQAISGLSTPQLQYLAGELNDTSASLESIGNSFTARYPGKKLPDQVTSANIEAVEQKTVQTLRGRLLGDVNQRDLSIPASHRDSINGDTLDRIALHAYYCLVHTGTDGKPVPIDHRVEHGLTMPEVSTLVERETQAAYEFLSQPSAMFLWTTYCTPELARKIRENRQRAKDELSPTSESVALARTEFMEQIKTLYPEMQDSVTEALVWHIIVESALVNERLITDMRETATLKNCPCIPTDWMPFFGPNPPPEARHAFGEYVRCKWPIHVFALDPVTQDQNISDSFSQRREMQMAMAIAASSRMLGGQAMSQFVRRMEYDLETIQLNRTAVAFSHGNNTFGWRFYPRVQAPPVPGNLQVCVQDLLIGGQNRNQLLNTRRLEPGIRECTALVVMPSFVPQVLVDVRTDWFRLAKHVPFSPFNKRKPDHEDSMELSKQLTDLRCLQTECMNDAHLYRDGDVYRLCKAVERLEDRLPMQTHNVPVPWENDMGGFEVFQSGTQVLGPEIHGWYGAPGIKVLNTQLERNLLTTIARLQQDLNSIRLELTVAKSRSSTDAQIKEITDRQTKTEGDLLTATNALAASEKLQTSTAVFLVGKNFSVLNCRVIAGGVDVTSTIEVINRNLMQVRIPSSVSTVSTNHTPSEQLSVVVHLATPYGATSRLLIPVAGTAEQSDVNKAIAEVKKTAADALKASERLPIKPTWGKDDVNKEFEIVRYSNDETPGEFEYKFNLPDQFTDKLDVHRNLSSDPSVEDPSSLNVNGTLLVTIKTPDSPKRGKVLIGELKAGVLQGPNLTAGEILNLIEPKLDEMIKRDSKGPMNVVVKGHIMLDGHDLPITLENTITFKVIMMPAKP